MITVNFLNLNTVEDSKLKFAVIMARYKEKWVFVKHNLRSTWEIPGGHREKNEDMNTTASRELVEETGAKDFKMTPVCIYSVNKDGIESFGQLFYSEIESLEDLPSSEIGEIRLFDKLPENLTYPLIQPYLFDKILQFIERGE